MAKRNFYDALGRLRSLRPCRTSSQLGCPTNYRLADLIVRPNLLIKAERRHIKSCEMCLLLISEESGLAYNNSQGRNDDICRTIAV